MADISAEIAAFQNAVYGEDVRTAMVSLANKVNNESSSAKESVNGAFIAKTTLTNTDDLNNVLEMGSYKIAYNNKPSNYPSTSDVSATLLVFTISNYISQLVISDNIYSRLKIGTSWTDWITAGDNGNDAIISTLWSNNLLPSSTEIVPVVPFIPAGSKITISRKDGQPLNTSTSRPSVIGYDSTKTRVGDISTNVSTVSRTVTIADDWYYVSWSSNPPTDYMVNRGNKVLSWEDFIYPIVPKVNSFDNDISRLYNLIRPGFLFIKNNAFPTVTTIGDGTATLTIPYELMCFFYPNISTTLAWDTITTNISSNVVINGSSITITIPSYRILVLNTNDFKLYFRSRSNISYYDFPMLYNGASEMHGWAIDYENDKKRFYLSDAVLASGAGRVNDLYKRRNQDTAIELMASSMVNKTDFENFIFVTDPHIYSDSILYSFMHYLEYVYKRSEFQFVLFGGDWLNNSDTVTEACVKLTKIKGATKNIDPSYHLIGNHDTNYQGVERFSTQTIKNIFYNGSNTYYKFNGKNTAFYCFDSGVEQQSLSAMDGLGADQLNWYATSILTEEKPHIVICTHILYSTSDNIPGSLQPLMRAVLSVSEAYNNRRTIVSETNNSYDYTNATGKVELVIFGHMHLDYAGVQNGITAVATKNAWISGGPHFDLVNIDYESNKVNLYRIGTGENRSISLINS